MLQFWGFIDGREEQEQLGKEKKWQLANWEFKSKRKLLTESNIEFRSANKEGCIQIYSNFFLCSSLEYFQSFCFNMQQITCILIFTVY